jgi:uncharacterized protein (DUF2236 family)
MLSSSPSVSSAPFIPFGPDSQMWRINREILVLLAGPAAAVLQVAHPVVARGVAAHSNFRKDSTGRLARTLDAVYTVAFGTEEEVRRVRREVARAHAAVRGEGYNAFDPEAQLWVMATLILGSTSMFRRFVAPLSNAELEAFLDESAAFGAVFGLDPALLPKSWNAFEKYCYSMLHGKLLGSEAICGEVARAVICPDAPIFMRALSPIFRALALELLPAQLAERLGLGKSRLRRPLWKTLDILLPPLLDKMPRALRFAPAYLRALKRVTES